ncbi:MAG: hypothetical protein KME54_17995 [Tolypothrix brevis GSE-NOS-MK-07-07A]|nr:hypothetical protein [Tolypothrix brevis GSE-NOS-MK-07-07A]
MLVVAVIVAVRRDAPRPVEGRLIPPNSLNRVAISYQNFFTAKVGFLGPNNF